MFKRKHAPEFDDWICVYETSLEFDANLIKSYLSGLEIPCQILSKKDTTFDVNFGDLSIIYIYVPKDEETAAREALDEWEHNAGPQNESDADDD